MNKDWLGNPIIVSGDDTVSGIDDFIRGFLGYENKAANILEAADNAPDCCIVNAYAAIFYMFLESRDAPALALPYLEKAEQASIGATRREQLTVGTVRAWVDNDIAKAIKLSHQCADEFPRDLPVVKTAQYHCFNLGDCAGMLSIAHKAASASEDIPYMHGLSAFAFEQCHLLDEAEAAARCAIDMQRKEPWAHHALAHVMLTQGRIEEGVDFLEDVSETWTDLNSFMVTHNWWHLALKYITQGRYDEALEIYDNNVWGVWKEYSQDQVGAVSLLLRLELVGINVGDRWNDVADHLKVRVSDFVQPFLTMQYIYGLARADYPEADDMLINLREFAPTTPSFVQRAWTEVAVPACEGLISHARGNHEDVVQKMSAILPRLLEIGGSHAQRGLFEQVLLDSMIKTQRYSIAQQRLEMQRAYAPNSVPVNSALADVYQNLGLPAEAARAQARIN